MLDTGNLDETGKPVISMALSNVGTGPAQIAWFRVSDAKGDDYSGGALYERVQKLDPRSHFESQQIRHAYAERGRAFRLQVVQTRR